MSVAVVVSRYRNNFPPIRSTDVNSSCRSLVPLCLCCALSQCCSVCPTAAWRIAIRHWPVRPPLQRPAVRPSASSTRPLRNRRPTTTCCSSVCPHRPLYRSSNNVTRPPTTINAIVIKVMSDSPSFHSALLPFFFAQHHLPNAKSV